MNANSYNSDTGYIGTNSAGALPGEYQSGSCGSCGAPEYSPLVWNGIAPPSPRKSCFCTQTISIPSVWVTSTSIGSFSYGPSVTEQERDLYKRALLQIRKCKDSPDTIQAILDVVLIGE